MGKIINFKTYEDFDKYFYNQRLRKIRGGSEGVCFYSPTDKLVYKRLIRDEPYITTYKVEDVIMKEDSKSKQYLFPEELFAVDGMVLGTKTEYVKKDYFERFIYGHTEDIQGIDFGRLIDAYYRMKEDTKILVDERIQVYDLSYNMLFDGDELFGIDTLGYTRSKENEENRNMRCLDNAVKDYFEMWTDFDEKVNKEVKELADYPVEKYLRSIEKMFVPKSKIKVKR